MSELTRKYFDLHGASFDSLYGGRSCFGRWFDRKFRPAIYTRFHTTFEESGDVHGKSVLDVGCGSGPYVVEFARRGARRIVGIDLSTRMLELARRRVEIEGLGDCCEFLCGDFLTVQLAQPYDIVVALGVFDYVDRPVAVLKKMAAASKGLVIASFPGRSMLRRYLRWARYRLRNCPVFFYSEDQVRSLAHAAGLMDYTLQFVAHSGTGYILVGRVRSALRVPDECGFSCTAQRSSIPAPPNDRT
jgi:SAM-dependent methyltransferase